MTPFYGDALNGPATLSSTANFGTAATSACVADDHAQPRNLRGDQRRHAICRHGLQPAWPHAGRRSAGRLLVRHHRDQWRHRRQLRQRPVAHDRAGAAGHLQRSERAAAPEWPVIHRHAGSGTPLAETASTNGAGNLVTQSIESSNVDIATEFSKLIVAQQAYSANTKMVTTADQMLQQTDQHEAVGVAW